MNDDLPLSQFDPMPDLRHCCVYCLAGGPPLRDYPYIVSVRVACRVAGVIGDCDNADDDVCLSDGIGLLMIAEMTRSVFLVIVQDVAMIVNVCFYAQCNE